MLRKKTTFVLSYLTSLLLLAPPVFAAGTSNQLCGIGEPKIEDFVAEIFGCGVSLVGGVAILFIIYGGFIFVTSGGDPTKVRIGKEYITYAIIGTALAIFTIIILEILGLDIFHLPGFST